MAQLENPKLDKQAGKLDLETSTNLTDVARRKSIQQNMNAEQAIESSCLYNFPRVFKDWQVLNS